MILTLGFLGILVGWNFNKEKELLGNAAFVESELSSVCFNPGNSRSVDFLASLDQDAYLYIGFVLVCLRAECE